MQNNILACKKDSLSYVQTHQADPPTHQAELDKRIELVLDFCKTPKTREEIQNLLGLKDRNNFKKQILNPLLEKGLLSPIDTDLPSNPKQKYYTT